ARGEGRAENGDILRGCVVGVIGICGVGAGCHAQLIRTRGAIGSVLHVEPHGDGARLAGGEVAERTVNDNVAAAS
ncbi:hypothetical protein COW95_00925, partial [Candidatus Peregrinibacteria bacterium CG22_combo_CG10-13_8_21_14_all_49_11]